MEAWHGKCSTRSCWLALYHEGVCAGVLDVQAHLTDLAPLQVLQGTLQETLYDWPSPGQPPRVRQQRNLTKDAVGYMSDDVGLHKLCNASDSQAAVSLHCNHYSVSLSSHDADRVQYTLHHGQNRGDVMCMERAVAK